MESGIFSINFSVKDIHAFKAFYEMPGLKTSPGLSPGTGLF